MWCKRELRTRIPFPPHPNPNPNPRTPLPSCKEMADETRRKPLVLEGMLKKRAVRWRCTPCLRALPSHINHTPYPTPPHVSPQRGKSVLGKMSKSWKERYVIAEPEAMLLTYKEGGAAVRTGTSCSQCRPFVPFHLSSDTSLSPATPRARSRAHSASRGFLSSPMSALSPTHSR